jgi:hypothetical protein
MKGTADEYANRILKPKDFTSGRLQGKMAISYKIWYWRLRSSMIPKGCDEGESTRLTRVSLALRCHTLRRMCAFAAAHTLTFEELAMFEQCGRFYMRLIKNSGLPCTDTTIYLALALPAWLEKHKMLLLVNDNELLAGGSLFSCQGGEHMNYVAKILILITTNLHDGFLTTYAQERQRMSVAGEQGVKEYCGPDTFKEHSKSRFKPCEEGGSCICGAPGPLSGAPADLTTPPEWLFLGGCVSCIEMRQVWSDLCLPGPPRGRSAVTLLDEAHRAQARRVALFYDADMDLKAAAIEKRVEAEAKAKNVRGLVCPLEAMGGLGVSPLESTAATPDDLPNFQPAPPPGESETAEEMAANFLGLADLL